MIFYVLSDDIDRSEIILTSIDEYKKFLIVFPSKDYSHFDDPSPGDHRTGKLQNTVQRQ